MARRTIGEGSLSLLRGGVAALGSDGPFLLVRGKSSFEHNGLSDYTLATFAPADYHVYTISHPLPTLNEYADFWRKHGQTRFGCVVAAGGGHVIDFSKLISLGCSYEELCSAVLCGCPLSRRLPLIAIPTTMGSGSEETGFAVVYIGEHKYSVDNHTIRPDYVIVDPQLAVTLSERQLAISGLDVITQSIESLLSRRTNAVSARFARRALLLGWNTLPKLIQTRNNRDYRRMSLSANLAGRAIAITRTTIPHAVSYYLTARFGVPHGHAVALSMGRYLELFNQKLLSGDETLQEFHEAFLYICRVFRCQTDEIHQTWLRFLLDVRLECYLGKIGLRYDDLRELAMYVNADRFANSPLNLSRNNIVSLFDF